MEVIGLEVEEKVVLDRFLKLFVELSEVEKKKRELRNAFVQEFNIEPKYITPKEARISFEIEDERAEIIDDVVEAIGFRPASDDEYYVLVFTARYNEDNLEQHDWTLVTDYGLPFLRKCTGDYIYTVSIEIWRYDDCKLFFYIFYFKE